MVTLLVPIINALCFGVSDKQERAHSHYDHSLLYKYWQQLAGYVVSIKTERYRREYRFTSVAVTHYR